MTSMAESPKASARERLLDAAAELFYREGVQSVGIDRVIGHAGVAKASLYNTFGSKDELVHAYLQRRHASTTSRITAAIARHRTPRAKLLAVFDTQAEVIQRPGYRGCAFSSASAESKPGGLVDADTVAYRAWFRALFVDLATQGGARNPALLGHQLQLIYDGTAQSANLDHDPSVTKTARAAALSLWTMSTR